MNDLWRRIDELPVTVFVGVLYLVMAFVTDPMQPSVRELVHYGAARPVDIADGEAWRLLTYAFLHGGWWHLGMNLYALVTLGPALERSIGSGRFAVLYVVGALGGGIGGCLWHHPLAPLVGGSGALFAMLGAFLVLVARGGRDPTHLLTQPIGRALLSNILVNFALGLVFPIISTAAHLGGLLAGIAVTWCFLTHGRAEAPGARALRVAVTVAFLGGLVAVVRPVGRFDFLLLEWSRTAPGPRRDEVRVAFLHSILGDAASVSPSMVPDRLLLSDDDMDEQVEDLRRARRFE